MTALATGVATLYAARVLGRVGRGPAPALTRSGHRTGCRRMNGRRRSATRAARRAVGAGDRRADRHPASRLARLAADVRRAVRPVGTPGCRLWWFLFRDRPADSFVNKAELDQLIRASPVVGTGAACRPEVVARHGRDRRPALQPHAARSLLGVLRLWLFPVLLHDLAAELRSSVEYGLNLGAVGLFTVAPWLAAAVLLWLFGRLWTICSPPPAACASPRSYLIAGTQFVAAIAVIPVAMTDDLHGRHRRHHRGGCRLRWVPTPPTMR